MSLASDHAVEATSTSAESAEIAGRSLTQIAWRRLRRDKVAMTSLLVVLVIVSIAALAPVITRLVGVDPSSFNDKAVSDAGGLPLGRLGGVSLAHPLGVEPGTGRDLFARLLYGSRISLLIALSATLITVTLGVSVGIVAGYSRGWLDSALGRLMDVILAFPLILILLALSNVLTQRLETTFHLGELVARVLYLILVLSLFGWPYLARIVRGQVLSLREREFVESAVSMGAGTPRILFREILPNLWAPILVYATLLLPTYIAAEAALSYLGVGLVPPTPSWGAMLADSVRYFAVDPAFLFIPGTYLFVVVLAFNLLGDAVRDALDPRAGRA
ncbi:MAG: peptide/nickel transport system permease protein [Actinomycetota bacterium]|jgi:ABC-type dipeptide/oligopeptide/nickel transport system permease subunit|nr:peptide/nickel transport system permease protein [Actinomycetota bacterium]